MPIQPIFHHVIVPNVRYPRLEVQLQTGSDSEPHATKIPGLVRFA